jgi:mannose-6-phosphate isomerase class I
MFFVLSLQQRTEEMILYRPPCAEFEVLKVELNSFSIIDIAALPTASFYLILKGETSISNQQECGRFEKGDCIFVPANTSVSLKSQHCDCLLYRASCNLTALNL